MAAAKKAPAKKVVANTVTKLTAEKAIAAPTVKVGRLVLPFNILTVKELEDKVAAIESTVLVIRKPSKTKLYGYVYAGYTASGRVHAIKPCKTLDALQARLADYGLKPDQYEIVSTSVTANPAG